LPWIRRLGDAKANGVIVFVHGVLGDARATWSNGNAYWPALLTGDNTFDGQDIYVFGYPSTKFGKTFSIDELAENLRLVLSTDGVMQYKQLTFVSHSMGGLVTRAFLLKYQSQVVAKIRFLYFFATPTTGSPYAALAKLVSRNPQFGQMYPMDADSYLGPLQSNWLAANLKLRSYCAYETQAILGQIIVERQSATNLCTERLDPIDASHIDIVKPVNVNSTAYRALKMAFMETASHEAKPIGSQTGSVKPQPSPAGAKLFPTIDRSKLRFGLSLGWQLGRFEFIDSSDIPEAQAARPGLQSEILSLLAQDGYPSTAGSQHFDELIGGVLRHYGTTDIDKHTAILVGIGAFRMTLVGASSNEDHNAEMEKLAASAIQEIDPGRLSRKTEFVRILRERRPKNIPELLSLLDWMAQR